VYGSNNQLGGIEVMYRNGVSHDTAQDDMGGVSLMLRWLSYMPERQGSLLPIMPPLDPVDRPIQFRPTKAPYDPRWMLAGRPLPSDPTQWESGFFDKDSFLEILDGWARTVVTGRARLGGIPVGCIAVETRITDLRVPADPANLDSEAKVCMILGLTLLFSSSCVLQIIAQAGQVWYPDSSYKTAQAIMDFSREELPLMIFANWRGFSGGAKGIFSTRIAIFLFTFYCASQICLI
jgi:acetyl-CoA carboxylase carboxyltransferase component